jgi:hypothetical protein
MKYCQECGKKLADNATSCPSCGFSFKTIVIVNKSKTTAILLAVLFGLFSWCYTYKYDAWKFWLNVGLTILTLGLWGFVALFWVIIDQSIKSSDFFENY